MRIVDCASDVNDEQDPRIQNISDSDELSEQKSSNSTGQKFAKFKQPSTSSTGSYCSSQSNVTIQLCLKKRA